MTEFGTLASIWLLRTLAAGGALLLLAWLSLRLVRDPARRARLAAWTIRGAVLAAVLGFFPAWLTIPISLRESKADDPPVVKPAPVTEPAPLSAEADWPSSGAVEVIASPLEIEPPGLPAVETPAEAAAAPPAQAPADREAELLSWVLAAYAALALLAALQFLLGAVALARWRRGSRSAPGSVQQLAAELAAPLGLHPQVRVSTRIASPVCFGWLRPVVLLPQRLADAAEPNELRWVLAHEIDHLRRGDPRTSLWLGLARIVYFALPWFWALRRELRLAQEYLADAAAAAGRPADYAAFLVSLSGMPVRRGAPLGAVAVRAGRTDLYRRVSMLTQSQSAVRDRCSKTWSFLTAAAALGAAVVFSGVGFADDPKPRVKVVVLDDEKRPDDAKAKSAKKAEEMAIEVKVAGASADVQKLMKAISDALEKGDVDGAKKLMAKLSETLAQPPKMMAFPGGPVTLFAPAGGMGYVKVPGAQPPAAADMKKMEEKLASLVKALEQVKDSPEAREALERTIAEFKKKIAEAKDRVKTAGQALPQLPQGYPVEVEKQYRAQVNEARARAEQARADAERAMKMLELELQKNNGEGAKALEAAREQTRKQLGLLQRYEGDYAAAVAGGGRLGVQIDPVPPVLAVQFDLPKGQCVVVSSVNHDSPADKAGIKQNDVLMEIAGKPVPGTPEDVVKLVGGLKTGDKFDIKVLRKGKTETIKDVVIPEPKKVATAKKRDMSDSPKDEKPGVSFNSMMVNVNDGKFKIEASNDEIKINVVGHFDDGKPVADKVSGSHDGVDFSTKDLASLSKSDRAVVEQLLKNVSYSKREE